MVLFCTACFVASIGLVSRAVAQSPTNIGDGDQQQSDGSPDTAEHARRLDTVQVTARKRTESALDVPSSVAVVTADQIEQLHVTRLADLNGYIPSLLVTDGGGPGQTSVMLRGIPTVGPAAVVGTYLDESPVGSSNNLSAASLFVLDLLPDDIDRIEVLRGPQGTLYGASSLGGQLKYITAEPDLNAASGHFRSGLSWLSASNGYAQDTAFNFNAPLIPDQLAMRLSLANNRLPGTIDNVADSRRDINNGRQGSERLAVRWKPSDDVDVKLNFLRQNIDEHDNNFIVVDPVTNKPLFGDGETQKLVEEPFKKLVDYQAAVVDWDLHWADFVSATSHSRLTTRSTTDTTSTYGSSLGVPAGISAFYLYLGLDKWTEELRLSSKQGSRFDWLVGVFYTIERSRNAQRLTAEDLAHESIPGVDPLLSAQLPSIYKEEALFADVTYHLSDSIDITAGLRHARNQQHFHQDVNGGIIAPLGVNYGASKEGVTTFVLSPSYRLDGRAMLYARVASGYRPGGPNIAIPGIPPFVKSDTLVSYELGFKSTLAADHALIDAAIFDVEWKDIQYSEVTSTGLTYFANAGAARTRGFDVSANYSFAHGAFLQFASSYTTAVITSGLGQGSPLPNVPRWVASLTGDWDFPLAKQWSGRLAGGYTWYSERETGLEGSPLNHRLPNVTQANVSVAFYRAPWEIQVFAKNVFDQRTYVGMTDVVNLATGNVTVFANTPTPRMIGIEVEYKF